jgi:hypothetical protein
MQAIQKGERRILDKELEGGISLHVHQREDSASVGLAVPHGAGFLFLHTKDLKDLKGKKHQQIILVAHNEEASKALLNALRAAIRFLDPPHAPLLKRKEVSQQIRAVPAPCGPEKVSA